MHASEYQEELEISERDDNCTAFQELKDEAISLQQQRTLLNDQQALLDLERAELEQQLSELEIKYAHPECSHHSTRSERSDTDLRVRGRTYGRREEESSPGETLSTYTSPTYQK